MSSTVTDEMVEAAGKALYESGDGVWCYTSSRPYRWDELNESDRGYDRDRARVVLEAGVAVQPVSENHRLASEKVHELNSAALVMRAEIDFLRNALRIGAELDNHHNAGWCPYCSKRPSPEQFKSLVDDCLGIQFGKHDNEPVEVGMAAVVIHVSDTVRKGFR
jgi:hypothetical protein